MAFSSRRCFSIRVATPRSSSFLSLFHSRQASVLTFLQRPSVCHRPRQTWLPFGASATSLARKSLASRCFSSGAGAAQDPYQALGVPRSASEAEIKKAYREKALKWHPDRNPAEKRDEAQRRFAEASNAYDILGDPQKRQEYDTYGRVGGEAPSGPNGAHGGGFPGGTVSQAEAERILREAFGGQFGGNGMEQILQQLLMQQQQQHQMPGQQHGCGRRQRPRGVLQAEMEVRIRHDAAAVHRASRASKIDTEYDERRARYVGKLATITKVDPSDQSVKLRVMVSPGRADEVWFGAGAVWIPQDLETDDEIQVCADVATIHKSSREVGIDTENDDRRARCAGKLGTVIKVDRGDNSVKARVIVSPGRADELWFGVGALEHIPQGMP